MQYIFAVTSGSPSRFGSYKRTHINNLVLKACQNLLDLDPVRIDKNPIKLDLFLQYLLPQVNIKNIIVLIIFYNFPFMIQIQREFYYLEAGCHS